MRFFTKNTIAALFAVALPVIGCSGDENKNPTGGGGTLTFAEMVTKLQEAYCTNAVDCHRAETKEECLASPEFRPDEIQPYLDDGTIVFDGAGADACLEAFGVFGGCSLTEAFAAGGVDKLETACNSMLKGTVADGAACKRDEQCVSGNCDLVDPMCVDACCAQKCYPPEQPMALPKLGEACPMYQCESGAYCQTDQMGMPTTCAKAVDAGQPCKSVSECNLPSFCNIDPMTMMGTCKLPSPHGGACDPMGFLQCDRSDDYCDPMTKKCTTYPLPGAACQDGDCVDYAYYDQTTMKCVKDLAAGAACTDMTDCQGGLSCEMGKCAFDTTPACP